MRNLFRPLRRKILSTHLLLFLPEKNRSGHLVRTALRENLENLSSLHSQVDRTGLSLKRSKELEPLLDGELRFFFGNEMSASLDLTAADVVGNVVPGGCDVPKKRLSAPGRADP